MVFLFFCLVFLVFLSKSGTLCTRIGCALTLKQTQKEKGMVTTTSSQQRAVRIHPQIPIPVSLSSAAGANETILGKSIKNSDVNTRRWAQRIRIFLKKFWHESCDHLRVYQKSWMFTWHIGQHFQVEYFPLLHLKRVHSQFTIEEHRLMD